jgi:hypothetical protein
MRGVASLDARPCPDFAAFTFSTACALRCEHLLVLQVRHRADDGAERNLPLPRRTSSKLLDLRVNESGASSRMMSESSQAGGPIRRAPGAGDGRLSPREKDARVSATAPSRGAGTTSRSGFVRNGQRYPALHTASANQILLGRPPRFPMSHQAVAVRYAKRSLFAAIGTFGRVSSLAFAHGREIHGARNCPIC